MGSVARRRGRGALAPRGLSRVSTAAHAAINGPQLALHNTLANIPLISIRQLIVVCPITASCCSHQLKIITGSAY